MAGSGNNTATVAFGGEPATAATELWNGSSWSNQNNLNVARDNTAASNSSSTAALAFGGGPNPGIAATEEWNNPGTITKTLTS